LDVDLYRAANKDLASIKDRFRLIAHLLKEGVREQRYSIKPTDVDAGIFTAVADQLSIRGDYAAANLIYEKILNQVPTAVEARQHYADNLLRQKQYRAAAEFYRTSIERREFNIWSFINLASCYKAIGDLRGALFALRDGSFHFAHDMGLRRRVADAIEEYFQNEWHLVWCEAELGRISDCHDRLRGLCADITPVMPAGLRPRPIRSIAIVGDEGLPQCRLYRIEQKQEQLSTAGLVVYRYDFNTVIRQFLAKIARYEAVIFYRVPALPSVIEAIARSRELGLATIYEIDGLIFEREHFPPSLESYRGQITMEEYAGLAVGVPAFAHSMSLCDFGIASTPPLAREMARIVRSGRVFLHRNGLGRRHEAEMLLPVSTKTREQVVIFYGSGTKAHKEDFEELVEPALIELVRRYGDKLSIVIVGYISWTPASRAIRNNIVQLDPTSEIEAYWNLLRTADINLAVLKPSLMADCKSELKWLEAAMFGIPSVVSRTATFAEVIEHGVTGFLCEDVQDWVESLDRLVRDARLRNQVGRAAQRVVLERYGMTTLSGNIASYFSQLAQPAAPRAKIVIVNVFYPPQTKGGATRVVHDNVAALSSTYGDEFEVEVFATMEGGLVPYEKQVYAHEGIRVTAITTPDDPDIDHKLFDKRMGEIFDEYLETAAPAVVHFHCIQRLTVAVVDAARRRNIPYLITAHDGYWISNHQFLIDGRDKMQLYGYDNPLKVVETYGMSARQKALRSARRVLCVSESFGRLYRECNVQNVMALPNGVSALPHAVRRRSIDGRVRLAHIGGAMRHKGLHLVKCALLSETFNHLRLTVVDHAQSKGFLRREVWGTTPVEFIGLVPQKDVGDLYAEIDVLLSPSIWPESYGLVTREALACGCWVLASDRGSAGEYVIEGENGYIVDVSDIAGLVHALRKIDDNHSRYLESPTIIPQIRLASQQADDLAVLYRAIISVDGKGAIPATTRSIDRTRSGGRQGRKKGTKASAVSSK
jgi:glycosyltransferase involved in cell wall biosynthesis